MTESVTRSELDKQIGNEAIANQIEQGFGSLSDSTATQMMCGYAEGYLNGARSGYEVWQDSLFFAGVSLAHARLYSDNLREGVDINGNGWFVSTPENWDKQDFAELAIPAYTSGFREASHIVPRPIQSAVRSVYPVWFTQKFNGLGYSPEKIDLLLNPKPAVLPFDHYSQSRGFIGGTVHYPASYERRVFRYMKGWGFPPTMWYSNRPENDFEGYVRGKAGSNGVSVEEAVKETGRHEATHLLAIDPLIKLAMIGNEHCWLSEGVAQYFGDSKESQSTCIKGVGNKDVVEIADTAGKPIDYGASLLLTMSIAAKLSGSVRDIPAGMEKVVKRLTDRARLVSEGQAGRVNSPLELMYLLDPSLDKLINEEELVGIMHDVQKEHS